MQITLVSSAGSGSSSVIPVADGTTLQALVTTTQGAGKFRTTVKSRGDGNFTAREAGYVLQDGDTVSVSPADVKGALKVGGGVKKGGKVVGNEAKGKAGSAKKAAAAPKKSK